MKQTAVEWLYSELSKNNTSIDSVIERINKESSIWEQAKQMEKQQIIDAHLDGQCFSTTIEEIDYAKDYYNETFKE
jgi:hypothetical protein